MSVTRDALNRSNRLSHDDWTEISPLGRPRTFLAAGENCSIRIIGMRLRLIVTGIRRRSIEDISGSGVSRKERSNIIGEFSTRFVNRLCSI